MAPTALMMTSHNLFGVTTMSDTPRPAPVQDGALWFHTDTCKAVRDALNLAFVNRNFPEGRVRLWYGDTSTGRSWRDEYDVTGTISRSTGQYKIPILIATRRSSGGPGVLDNCIVRIDWTNGDRAYTHPHFTHGFEHATIHPHPEGRWGVRTVSDGPADALFDTEAKAKRWLAFMKGERYSK